MDTKRKLAIITTHPVQYNAPLFKLLASRNAIEIKVFYTWGKTVLINKFDPGFGKAVEWDLPLLEGYEFEFLENNAKEKGSHHFNGIKNPDIIWAIENYGPQAILVYGWSFKSHLKVLRYFKDKVPILFRGDSTLLDQNNFLKKIFRISILRWVYSKIDYALYVGKNNYMYFQAAGLRDSQLIFAGHAIDNYRFSCTTNECKNGALNFRETLNIPATDFIFLYAGKLELKKDPELLLKAFQNAFFEDQVHLVMVGDGNMSVSLRKKYSNNRNIHFKDFVNQSIMPSVYASSDVFILPSRGPGETWGLAVNEAMAAGKPVIVSNKCGCATDLVKDGINGFVFESGNVSALKESMNWFISNKDQIVEMGRMSEEIIANYTLLNIAINIEKAIVAKKDN